MAFSMTVSDYARHRGCDEKAVRKAIAEGRITAIGEGRERRIDPEVADIQWAKNTRARADSARPAVVQPLAQGSAPTVAPGATAGEAPPPAAGGYTDHRARREKAEADMAELEAQRQAGSLVRRDQAERAVIELFRVLRDSLLNANNTTALQVMGKTELREIKLILDDGYRAAFADAERRIREWQRSLLPAHLQASVAESQPGAGEGAVGP